MFNIDGTNNTLHINDRRSYCVRPFINEVSSSSSLPSGAEYGPAVDHYGGDAGEVRPFIKEVIVTHPVLHTVFSY